MRPSTQQASGIQTDIQAGIQAGIQTDNSRRRPLCRGSLANDAQGQHHGGGGHFPGRSLCSPAGPLKSACRVQCSLRRCSSHPPLLSAGQGDHQEVGQGSSMSTDANACCRAAGGGRRPPPQGRQQGRAADGSQSFLLMSLPGKLCKRPHEGSWLPRLVPVPAARSQRLPAVACEMRVTRQWLKHTNDVNSHAMRKTPPRASHPGAAWPWRWFRAFIRTISNPIAAAERFRRSSLHGRRRRRRCCSSAHAAASLCWPRYRDHRATNPRG